MTIAEGGIFVEMTATLGIVFKNERPSGIKGLVGWLEASLNANPEYIHAQVHMPSEGLAWPHFLDETGFDAERHDHPDNRAKQEEYKNVERWLMMDRKQLIDSLLAQHRAMKSLPETV